MTTESVDGLVVQWQWLYAVVFTLGGAWVGRLVNGVASRYAHEVFFCRWPVLVCSTCGVWSGMADSLPVIGYFCRSGQCRQCGKRLPPRVPVVEGMTAVLCGITAWVYAPIEGVCGPGMARLVVLEWGVALLVLISLIDLEQRIVPDWLSLPGLVAGLLASVSLPALHPESVTLLPSWPPSLASLAGGLLGAAVGAGLIYLLRLGGALSTRGMRARVAEEDPGMGGPVGLGDIKLMAFAGTLLGWEKAFFAVAVALVVGALTGTLVKLATGKAVPGEGTLAARLAARWHSGVSTMPFAPCLAAGSVLFLLWDSPL